MSSEKQLRSLANSHFENSKRLARLLVQTQTELAEAKKVLKWYANLDENPLFDPLVAERAQAFLEKYDHHTKLSKKYS